jgi:hypothetical protein
MLALLLSWLDANAAVKSTVTHSAAIHSAAARSVRRSNAGGAIAHRRAVAARIVNHQVVRRQTAARQIAQSQMPAQASFRQPDQSSASITSASRPAPPLTGIVTDPDGAIVRGATVMLIPPGASGHASAQTTTRTGPDGEYRLIPPSGTYTLVVEANGFSRFQSAAFRLDSGPAGLTQRNFDIHLKLQVHEEKIDVDSDLATVGNRGGNAIVISGHDVEAMPLEPSALLDELHGLAGSKDAELFVDGFSGVNLPPRSSIREIRINQNPYAAENDSNLISGVIQVATKPGTGQMHGQAYLYGVDSATDAGNPFAPSQPPYYAYSPGGDISGPMGHRASYFAGVDQTSLRMNSAIAAQTLDANLNPMAVNYAIPSPHTTLYANPRLDLRTGANGTLTLRYIYNNDHQANGGIGQLALASQAFSNTTVTQTLQVVNTQLIASKLVNESRLQYIRARAQQTPASQSPNLVVEGAFLGGGSDFGAFSDHQDKIELQNYLSLATAKHYFNFGGRLRVARDANDSLANFSGQFIFPTLAAYAAETPSEFNLNAGNPRANVTVADAGVFAQDDWKVASNFTLSYGVRFETQTYIPDHADWAPRLGFSWGLDSRNRSATPNFVLHGGAGIFYRRFTSDSALQIERENGIVQQEYVVTSPSFYATIPSIANLAAQATPTFYRLSPSFHAPTYLGASIALDRRLGSHGTATVTYMYNRGVHGQLMDNVNAPLPGTYNPANPTSGVRPLGTNQNIYESVSEGVYRSNRLTANFILRTGRFTAFSYYTLRHDHSDADSPTGFPSNQHNLGADYGRAQSDIRHTISGGENATLPFGFHTSAYFQAHTGAPFDIVVGQDLNGDTQFNDRPAFASDLNRPTVVATRWGNFDTSPITGQTIIPRNYGQGPGFFVVNFAFGRIFRYGPRGPADSAIGNGPPLRKFTLDLWVETQNLLNHPNLAPPVGTLNSPLFGQSTAVVGASALSPDRVLIFQTLTRF